MASAPTYLQSHTQTRRTLHLLNRAGHRAGRVTCQLAYVSESATRGSSPRPVRLKAGREAKRQSNSRFFACRTLQPILQPIVRATSPRNCKERGSKLTLQRPKPLAELSVKSKIGKVGVLCIKPLIKTARPRLANLAVQPSRR